VCLHAAGFGSMGYLDAADRSALVAIAQHAKFRQAQAWAGMKAEFDAAGATLTEEDRSVQLGVLAAPSCTGLCTLISAVKAGHCSQSSHPHCQAPALPAHCQAPALPEHCQAPALPAHCHVDASGPPLHAPNVPPPFCLPAAPLLQYAHGLYLGVCGAAGSECPQSASCNLGGAKRGARRPGAVPALVSARSSYGLAAMQRSGGSAAFCAIGIGDMARTRITRIFGWLHKEKTIPTCALWLWSRTSGVRKHALLSHGSTIWGVGLSW
jgi:hypothetical protein